jgi:hypothetical protein
LSAGVPGWTDWFTVYLFFHLKGNYIFAQSVLIHFTFPVAHYSDFLPFSHDGVPSCFKLLL